MSDWEDAGLPCIMQEGYSVTRDIGLLRTPFVSPNIRQTAGYKQPQWNFQCSIILSRDLLKTAEDFLDANGYDWFTIPLVSDGCLSEHTVRLTGAYSISTYDSTGANFKLTFPAQRYIPIDAPDLTAYLPAVDDKLCCTPDDIQCCSGGACAEIVWFENTTTNNGNWDEVGTGSYTAEWTDSVRVAVGVRFAAGGWGWSNAADWGSWWDAYIDQDPRYPPNNMVSQVITLPSSDIILSWNAEGLVSNWYTTPEFASYGIQRTTVDGEDVLTIGEFAVNSPGSFTVKAKCPFCEESSIWAVGTYTLT